MANYDDTNGVWRTIGGRRVFIREGKSLSEAMKESGKFKRSKKAESKENIEKKNSEKQIEKEFPDNLSDAVKEQARLLNTRSYDDIDDVVDDFAEEQGISRTEAKYALLKDEFKQRQGAYMDARADGSYSDAELNHMESMAKDSYFKLQEAQEQLDSFNEDNRKVPDAYKDSMITSRNDDEVIKDLNQRKEQLSNRKNRYTPEEYKEQEDGLNEGIKYAEQQKAGKNIVDEVNESNREYAKKKAEEYKNTKDPMFQDIKEERVREYERQAWRESQESKKEPKTFFDGKRDIEAEARQIYAEDGIRATSDRNLEYFSKKYDIPKDQAKAFIEDTAKRFDEENERKNKYNAYYKKENLGEPSNYQEGDKIEFRSFYDNKLKGEIVREATDEEKRYQMNTNLKGYIVKDNQGSEHVVPDTKIDKESVQRKESTEAPKYRWQDDEGNTIKPGKDYKKLNGGNYVKQNEDGSSTHIASARKGDGSIEYTRYDYDKGGNDVGKSKKYKSLEEAKAGSKKQASNNDFERWKEDNNEKIASYYTETYSKDLKNINNDIWNSIAKDIYDEEKEPEKINKGSNDWVRNAFNQYKKDHPKSKLTLADFTRKNKK